MAAREPFWKWHCLKSIGFYPLLLNFGIDIKAKLKLQFRNQKIQYGCQAPILKVTLLLINRLLPIATNNMHMKFETENSKQTPETMLRTESRNRKIQYGHQAAILKMTSMKINRLPPIYTSIVLLNFGVDIRSQTKGRVREPKNPKWPPGSHFGSDITENLLASYNQHVYEIWSWNFTANLTYAAETVSTDGPMDGRTDWQSESGKTPSNFVGQGCN